MRKFCEKSFDAILDEYARERKIFIDTCSLLHPGISDFWEMIIPYLKKYNNKVIIASANYHELAKHANNLNDAKLAQKAQSSLEVLARLWRDGVIEIRGEKDEQFADNVFLYVFMKFRLSHNLLLITQDRALARDIEALNTLESAKTHKTIIVRQINNNSRLEKIS